MPIVTNDKKYLAEAWFPVMKCPKCDRKATTTNICRECPETPADQPSTTPVTCGKHKGFHFTDDGKPMMHQSVAMEYTGWVENKDGKRMRFRPRTTDEARLLWIGYAVVFNELTGPHICPECLGKEGRSVVKMTRNMREPRFMCGCGYKGWVHTDLAGKIFITKRRMVK